LLFAVLILQDITSCEGKGLLRKLTEKHFVDKLRKLEESNVVLLVSLNEPTSMNTLSLSVERVWPDHFSNDFKPYDVIKVQCRSTGCEDLQVDEVYFIILDISKIGIQLVAHIKQENAGDIFEHRVGNILCQKSEFCRIQLTLPLKPRAIRHVRSVGQLNPPSVISPRTNCSESGSTLSSSCPTNLSIGHKFLNFIFEWPRDIFYNVMIHFGDTNYGFNITGIP